MYEISEFLLFTVTDGDYFKLPKITVKPYLQKVGNGIMVLQPTNVSFAGRCELEKNVVVAGGTVTNLSTDPNTGLPGQNF